MIKSLTIHFENQKVLDCTDNYGYKAYFMLRTTYGQDAQNGWMRALLFDEDDLGLYDSVPTLHIGAGEDTFNTAAKHRRLFFKTKTTPVKFQS